MAFGGLVETRADHPEAPVYQVRWPMNDTAIRAEFGLGTDTVVGIGQFLQAIAWLDSPLCGLIPKERNVRLLAYMQDKGGIVRVAEATRLQDGFELQRYSLDELFEATAEKGWLEHTYVLALERTRLYR
jgi:hypothetical protein